MASRPVFVPRTDGVRLVEEVSVEFKWHPGFAPIQKKKNVAALHAAAKLHKLARLLEVSTKSEDALGKHLSAFNLKVETREHGSVPLECVFQASKVFARGGPYLDLMGAPPRDARRDERLRDSGPLVAFSLDSHRWPLEPKTAFYDWLYVRALQALTAVRDELLHYDGFTDIEFNPNKSINCQARSCAIFVALLSKGQLNDALASVAEFVAAVSPDSREQPHSRGGKQGDLFEPS